MTGDRYCPACFKGNHPQSTLCWNCRGSLAPVPCSHPLLDEAGVKIGDEVTWIPHLALNGVSPLPRKMIVKGIHLGNHDINKGKPAIELTGEDGRGYRAYPSEIKCNANAELRHGGSAPLPPVSGSHS